METLNAVYNKSEDYLGWIAAENTADLRHDVAKSEADIKEAIHAQSLVQGQEFCGVNKSIHEAECAIIKNDCDIAHRNTIQLNSVERDLQNQILSNRSILLKEVGDKTDRVLDRMNGFERETYSKFHQLEVSGLKNTREILDRLSSDKLDEKNSEILKLRTRGDRDHYSNQFALQNQEINYLKQMLNSVEQNQRFTSKVVTFGNGNITPTTQTSNQTA